MGDYKLFHDFETGKKELYNLSEDISEITIGIASFAMETCTFCPRRTDTRHFEHYGPPLTGDEVLKFPWPGIAGFVHQSRQYPDVRTEGVYSPRRGE